MSDQSAALMVACYLVGHFVLYVLVFRHRRFFSTENGIFLFHMVPAVLLVATLSGLFLWSPSVDRFALVIGSGAAHGIYSLSFLEIWVLSEGGYSLRVLSELVRRGTATPEELEQKFVNVSARKKMGRIESLVGLGLVRTTGNRVELTGRGRMGAAVMAFIAAVAGFKPSRAQ